MVSSCRNDVFPNYSWNRISQKKLEYYKEFITLINCRILTGKKKEGKWNAIRDKKHLDRNGVDLIFWRHCTIIILSRHSNVKSITKILM